MKLSADQIIVDGTTAYVVAEADYETCPVCNGHDISHTGDVSSSCGSCDGGGNDVPQPWMTDAKCETCGGSAIQHHHDAPDKDDCCGVCPDCIDGKPIHTVEVECPDRLHLPPPPPEPWEDDPGYRPGDPECPLCDESGSISYRLVVREVLGIEDGDRVSPPDYASTNGYIIRSEKSELVGMREHWADGPLDLTLKPGGFLAICEVVE